MKLDGRFAIITGSGQGLGAAIADYYVREGASVLLCARNLQSLESVSKSLSGRLVEGQKVLIQQTDVSDPVQVDKLVSFALEVFPTIDIVVNNAGIYGPMGPLEEVDLDEWVHAININLLGTVYVCRAVLPHLKRKKYGKIINVSGGGATNPLPYITAYAASKAAVVRFTESLAEEVRQYGIDANLVAPGALATRLLDQAIEAGPNTIGLDFHKRMLAIRDSGGTPLSKGAELCVFLGSADSDRITGKLISALWDPWLDFGLYRKDLEQTDVYTLRRIVPSDRGLNFGES